MAIEIDLTAAALEDARTAFSWYEAQKAGLGVRFLGCLEECFEVVRRNPETFEILHK